MVCFPSASQEQIDAMTFQLAITTPTGVILASDLKHTNLYGFQNSTLAPKIHISISGRFAFCNAGDTDYGNLLVEEVERAIRKSSLDFTSETVRDQIALRNVLIQCVPKAKRKHIKARKDQGADKIHFGTTLFVFKYADACRLWCVDSSNPAPSVTASVGEYLKSGNVNTPAVFFPQEYIDKLEGNETSLIALAVHTVLMAKGDYVDGVEVGIFSPQRFECLSASELEPYKQRSKELYTAILDILRRDIGHTTA